VSHTTGFFTDVTLCIGCKACEVACKQWNELPADGYGLTGNSYDNTSHLGGNTWRHVAFVEQMDRTTPEQSRWMMLSDVCKHCTNAGCMEACPTGSIVRNEFGNVYVQPDICNGCGYCVPSCPFGVVAKACPTDSIVFGPVEELRRKADERVATLLARGTHVELYGTKEQMGAVGDLNAFFLLPDRPEVFNLPPNPVLPSSYQPGAYASLVAAVGLMALASYAIFRLRL
jgi:formate dehydrogenase iron-sulfur subunit